MSTGIGSLTGRPRAAWRSWLLGLLVLGIVGMHGLVLGSGTTAAHHAVSAPTVVVAEPGGPTTGLHAHDADPSTASSTPSPSDDADEGGATAIALCMALLLALAAGAAGARRTTWVSALDRLASRLALPAAPLLRDRTPVPRFTVMRC